MSFKVLAIDDSLTIRTLMERTLFRAGLDCCLAENGAIGLGKMEDYDPDVIVTDLNMPVLDGFGVIAGVRAHPKFSGKPVLVLTTEKSVELKTRARDAGATGWIVKPFDGEKLVKALRRVVG